MSAVADYAGRDWHVLACKAGGKIPVTSHGLKDATSDLDILEGVFRSHPDANIGVACEPSGVFVLDVDPRHGGDKHLAELVAKYGELPPTVTCETGGDGQHFYFRASPGTRYRGTVGDGLDIKANGYVIAPPSVHASGKSYRWRDGCDPDSVEVADAPEWLVRLATAGEVKTNGTPKQSAHGAIPNGQRNATLASLAGGMRRNGFDQEAIAAALHAENRAKCSPPLDDEEVERIAASVGRYEPAELKPDAAPIVRPVAKYKFRKLASDFPKLNTPCCGRAIS